MPPVPLYQEINESRLPGLGVVNILFWDCERHWIRLCLRENLQELVSSIGFLKKTNARRVEGGDLFFHHPSSLPRLPGELQFCLPVVSADDPPRLWVALVGSHDSCLVHVSVCFYNLVWIDGWMFCWEQTMTWGTEDWDIGIFANVLFFSYLFISFRWFHNDQLPSFQEVPENPPLFRSEVFRRTLQLQIQDSRRDAALNLLQVGMELTDSPQKWSSDPNYPLGDGVNICLCDHVVKKLGSPIFFKWSIPQQISVVFHGRWTPRGSTSSHSWTTSSMWCLGWA